MILPHISRQDHVNLPPLRVRIEQLLARMRVYTPSLPLWRTQYGRLPLHVAAMQQGTCAAVTVLLNAYPDAVAVKDNVRGRVAPSTSICPRCALRFLSVHHAFVSMAPSCHLHGMHAYARIVAQ